MNKAFAIATLTVLLCVAACGKQGNNGSNGAQGLPGAPGTTITMQQLCGSCVPTYPTIFPEWVVCANNQLYGVYSANDGFWSLLPPGTYSSNGINCSCTVVLGPNCEISS